ncbi:hypothetical protein LguiB_027923 [Lonicera macranthoides]
MGHEFLHKFPVESRRIVWLIGVLFAMVLVVQYFELPYGNVISSLISSGKAQILSPRPESFSNTTLFDGLNSTNMNVADEVHEIANITEISEGHDLSLRNDSMVERVKGKDGSELKKAKESEYEFSANNGTSERNSSSDENRSINVGPTGSSFASPPMRAAPPLASPIKVDANLGTPPTSERNPSSEKNRSDDVGPKVKNSTKKRFKNQATPVVSISEMNDMLLRSRVSSHSMKPIWSSAVDQELLEAKTQIENAPVTTKDPSLYAPLYRNVSMFRRSYEIMEQTLKVYIYREGERPIFHQPVLIGIYASEGWFMKQIQADKKFVTKDPKKAHLFYLPFSSRMLEEVLYVPDSHNHKNLIKHLKNYLDVITARYPFWNRTGGADHFLVACHDWAASETRQYMAKCIRALCNADIKEGFEIGKDVSLPETYVRSAQNPLKAVGGKRPSQRPFLAFYAGNMHGYLRPILLKHWENKDPVMKIFGPMPKSKGNKNYIQYMKSSKFCICPKGYEVNSPRVVEAIFYECVPVIISDNFVPPFFEVLNWEKFAVFVKEEEVKDLKSILLSISERRYKVMQQRVRKVQQHFLWHSKPVKYDIFHMILHSIWYNRVFQIRTR